MKTIIRKWYSHYEKEEEWLNTMAKRGLALTRYTWCKYVFEDCQPGEYIFRIEFLQENPSTPKGREYIEFMEETGADYISSYGHWVYFRKKAANGPFDIYSDTDSKINHYKRIATLWGSIGLMNIILAIPNLHSMNLSVSSINLIVGCVLVSQCIPYLIKIKKLGKEKLLRE